VHGRRGFLNNIVEHLRAPTRSSHGAIGFGRRGFRLRVSFKGSRVS
jgi:hypothetical protein